jgi:anti-anti-sigma regulatory factor
LLASESNPATGSAFGAEPVDWCHFGQSFDRPSTGCPAFQRIPFIAATSYGKPLGAHVACAHLQVGEAQRNQFYPRCALGSDRDRLRWIAMVGLGKFEVLRELNAAFEVMYAASLRQLIAAKAAMLTDPTPEKGVTRTTLAAVVQSFLKDFGDFVDAHAARIEEIGVAPASLTARAAEVLAEWQRSARVDLPTFDGREPLRRADAGPEIGENVVLVPGLLMARTSDPRGLTLVGQIDEANLDDVVAALGELTGSSPPAIVDVSAVNFCSVAGMRALVAAAIGGDVAVTGVQPQLRRALSAAGLLESLPPEDAATTLEVAS